MHPELAPATLEHLNCGQLLAVKHVAPRDQTDWAVLALRLDLLFACAHYWSAVLTQRTSLAVDLYLVGQVLHAQARLARRTLNLPSAPPAATAGQWC